MLTSIYRTVSLTCFLTYALFACGDDSDRAADGNGQAAADSSSAMPDASPSEPEPFAGCERSVLESDFEAPPLQGAGAPDGQLPAGNYIISTTYLTLRQEGPAQMRFGELMGPIAADLAAREGLVAYSLGSSRSCGTARTLAVWRDDMAMIDFVIGPAHAAAVSSVRDVSRGGSIVTHWQGSEATASWTAAVDHAGAYDGPRY
jgi:hypothetical protein